MFYAKIEVSHSLRVKGIPPIILLTVFNLNFFFLEFIYNRLIPL
jgi:hypothetical protein